MEVNSFWYLVIKSKYGMHKNGWNTADVNRGSGRGPWVYMSKGRAAFLSNIKLAIGSGQKIRL